MPIWSSMLVTEAEVMAFVLFGSSTSNDSRMLWRSV
jgi:hypothetical protein